MVVQADGGSRGNPGPAGFGSVVFDESGGVLAERFGFLGITTNNVAEYSGVIAGLGAAAALGATSVTVRLDSKLIVEQMNGRWQVRDAKIRPLARQVNELRRGFASVTFGWVPRERNKHADRLANLAMDRGTSGQVAVVPPGDPGLDPAAGQSIPASRTDITGSVGPALARQEPAAPRPGADPALTRIVLVRHGETVHSVAGRFAGQQDVALTDRGRDQAVAVAQRLGEFRRVPIWTSPLSRCRDTAAPIAARTGGAVTVVDALTDGRLGDWAGLTPEQIAARWPADFAAWRSDVEAAPAGGESYADVRRRAAPVLAEVVRRHPGGTIVLVTHAVVVKMMVIHALDVPSKAVYRLRVDPASLSMITVGPGGETLVATVNEVGHLPT